MTNFKIYVVTIRQRGELLYFVRQENRLTHKQGRVLNEPIGIFSPDCAAAKKFRDYQQAEHCASYFDGSIIEEI